MKKRLLGLILCVAMTAGMVMGCGSKSSEDSSSAENEEKANLV